MLLSLPLPLPPMLAVLTAPPATCLLRAGQGATGRGSGRRYYDVNGGEIGVIGDGRAAAGRQAAAAMFEAWRARAAGRRGGALLLLAVGRFP